MKKISRFFLAAALTVSIFCAVNLCFAEGSPMLDLNSTSVCLMEASSGQILYANNENEHLEPASVTKIMSLILIMEEIDKGNLGLDDLVSGSDHASSMGGSQIWLESGEQLSVNEMLKSIVVSSANDCTVAMAEHIAGSEETFVQRMNSKAEELGMENTCFSNCTGLPVENHYTTAHDIAVMTRELLKHELIFDYTCIWTDSVRNGQMGLSNTNKLIRFYNGANGMKTGFTSSALYCLSATAKRGDMQLIAATMKAPTSDMRFNDAKKLLDYGFANYAIYKPDVSKIKELPVTGGNADSVKIKAEGKSFIVAKESQNNIKQEITLEKKLCAPVKKGTAVGQIAYTLDGKTLHTEQIVTSTAVKRLGFFDIFKKMLSNSVALQ